MHKYEWEKYIMPIGQFRSRSEYFFAEWLDKWRIPWTYEPETFQINPAQKYIPDFVLPVTRVAVEVKPEIFKGEAYKMTALFRLMPKGWGYWVVSMRSNWTNRIPYVLEAGMHWEEDDWADRGPYNGYSESGFVLCIICQRPFAIMEGCFRCPHCRSYDGDHLIDGRFSEASVPPEYLKPLDQVGNWVSH